ncbi:MAG: hypothetical protein A2048_05780 [Deltaproteobacteria bacterium GWA2_45_12]|nr:MAG: hypothetical protein A2048_05780 [Deltaproteobacteria bacterium GWA2_45_12]
MNKKQLLIIFLVVFIDLLGFGMVIPILPYYAKTFGASGVEVGWLMMSYSAMQFLFSPFWGRLSDKIGRRPVLLICLAGIGSSMVVLAMASSFMWLLVARVLAGFFGANISAASAYIADITTPENRAKGMGLIGAAFGAGFLFGPALGGILSQWGYDKAPLFAAGLSVINLIFAFKSLVEPALSERERASHRNRFNREMWLQIISTPQTGLAILLFFIVTLGIAQMETTFALFLLSRFGLDAFHAGLILALMGLIMVGIQGGGIGKLAKKFGERKLILYGAVLMMLALGGAGLSRTIPLFVLFSAVQAAGYGITSPSLMSLVSRYAPVGQQGATMGVYQSAGSLGRILGPLCAGFLFDVFSPSTPFFVASGLFVIVFLFGSLKGSAWSSDATC